MPAYGSHTHTSTHTDILKHTYIHVYIHTVPPALTVCEYSDRSAEQVTAVGSSPLVFISVIASLPSRTVALPNLAACVVMLRLNVCIICHRKIIQHHNSLNHVLRVHATDRVKKRRRGHTGDGVCV